MEPTKDSAITQENFKKIHKEAIKEITRYTKKQKAALSEEVTFYRTVDSQFANQLDGLSERIKTKLNQMIANFDLNGSERYEGATEAFDADTWYSDIIKMNDVLMKKAVKEVSGRRNKLAAFPSLIPTQQPLPKQLTPIAGKVHKRVRSGEVNGGHSRFIGRPQTKFEDKIDNSGAPFVPKLPDKPNSRVPLDIEGIKDGKCNPHPYHYEITNITYPSQIFEYKEPIEYLPIQSTSFTWVDKLDELLDMCRKLENSQEIAVDLEHHSYRSYLGFTCLLQISTREEDFVVDVLELRSRLHLLNKSFTNPNILKVLHGADYDIIWLQKDFGVYVVNLFDTGVASHVLEMPQHSLAYLLKHYCNVVADKKYQLADWRLRPLTEEMLNYARADTHYLLYIYDLMRNELITSSSDQLTLDRLKETFDRSAQVSLRVHATFRYNKSGEGPGGYKKLLAKWNASFNEKQALHEWRDCIARLKDEGIVYVLPNKMLSLLAEKMPENLDEIGECLGYIPPLVRANVFDVIMQIVNAKSKTSQASTSTLNNPTTQYKVVYNKESLNQMEVFESEKISASILNNTITRDNVVYNKESQSSNQMEGIEPTGGLILDVPGLKYRGSDFSKNESLLFGDTLNNETKIRDEVKGRVAEIVSSFKSFVPVLPRLITTKTSVKRPFEDEDVADKKDRRNRLRKEESIDSKNTEIKEEKIKEETIGTTSAITNQDISTTTQKDTSTTSQQYNSTFSQYEKNWLRCCMVM
ncbi:10707_t:CDS:10 [Diversispora eburnea]|uniref:10707_t:CDS:1 n=1 Tax=Diversispora eburnea TaxID=1213867 RepID=A0A9N8UVZ9_9GLOM|nr:10707_t:CDS:10 [Diversispora eburnea]